MERPYVICHMAISIDGKVTGDFLFHEDAMRGTEHYYRINREYGADAFGCGSVTMEGSFTGCYQPDLSAFAGAKLPRTDYVADRTARYYAVSFDRTGRVGWKQSRIYDEDPGYNDAHIIEVLCEKASDAYLAYLQSIGVSYIFAGKEDMDVSVALEKLYSLFGIKTFMLEGGSIINGAFQRVGLIDELSLVQIPLVAGKDSKPLFCDSEMECYALTRSEPLEGSSQWFVFKKNQGGTSDA